MSKGPNNQVAPRTHEHPVDVARQSRRRGDWILEILSVQAAEQVAAAREASDEIVETWLQGVPDEDDGRAAASVGADPMRHDLGTLIAETLLGRAPAPY